MPLWTGKQKLERGKQKDEDDNTLREKKITLFTENEKLPFSLPLIYEDCGELNSSPNITYRWQRPLHGLERVSLSGVLEKNSKIEITHWQDKGHPYFVRMVVIYKCVPLYELRNSVHYFAYFVN